MIELLRRCMPAIAVALLACYDARPNQPQVGGDSHFLRTCESSCGAGYECVCGVCTKPCTSAKQCSALADQATCLAADGIGDTRDCSMQTTRPTANVCDQRCMSNRDCAGAGMASECRAGLCREPSEPQSTQSATVGAGPGGGSTAAATAASTNAASPPAPIVMLLLDTSGSMEQLAGCSCTSPGCTECLPNCNQSQQNRWTQVVSALTGSFATFGCTALDRTTENGFTYDIGYFVPHFAINPESKQRYDGVLDRYAGAVSFGVATFDGWDTYVGAPPLVSEPSFDFFVSDSELGLYSYGGTDATGAVRVRPDGSRVGSFRYPNAVDDSLMDTGIRSASAAEGALIVAPTLATSQARIADMKRTVRAAHPYGGTPIAAALDDLYTLFTDDPTGYAGVARSTKRYVVLLTDGYPDDDYRSYGCDCAAAGTCASFAPSISEDPSLYHCPYPTPDAAALHLRCGFDADCSGPVDAVYVVGFSTGDPKVRDALDKIAGSGGSGTARYASDPIELRDALNAIMDEVVKGGPN